MAEVKWIKLSSTIFDDTKIKQLETLPDGDTIIVIWLKLLCLAGNINDNGFIYLTKEIPYTDQMLATQFNRPLTTVQFALNVFSQYGMIELIDNILYVSNWNKYQNTDKLAEIREYNRLAQQKSRAKKKLLLAESNVNDKSMTSQPCQDTDIDIEEDKDIEKDIKNKKKEVRHKYGEYKNVLLSDTDYQKLISEFPADYMARIERLSEYMASTGKSYKNHLATIRNWARKETPKGCVNNGTVKKDNSFTDIGTVL
jgi:predicted phage replisome organizer